MKGENNSQPLFYFSESNVSDESSPAWRTVPTKMTSSEAFVETMVAHGTKNVFGIVGSAFMDALDIFEPAGIRFVPVQVTFVKNLQNQVRFEISLSNEINQRDDIEPFLARTKCSSHG